MKSMYLFAVAAAAVAAPALAQESAPFTGFRVEAIAGYDSVGIKGAKNPNGVVYGIGAGYDAQLGGALVGVETELSGSTAELKLVGPNLKSGRDIYVGARVGAVVGGNFVLYAKAGYTNFRVSYAGSGENGDGFRAGVGGEYALSQNLFLKAEYRYSNYEAGVTRNQVVGGLGFRF